MCLSLLAKLDKADRAFCFTSGMAALAAVTHLLKSGTFPILTTLLLNCFFYPLGLLHRLALIVVLFNFVSIGDELVAGDDLYGGSDRLLSNVVPRSGVVVK